MSTLATKQDIILRDPRIYRGLFLLSVPLMLNNLVKSIHDLVDMFFVSQLPGDVADALSSISITFPVMFVFISLGVGLQVSGISLVSQLLGSNQEKKAFHFTQNLILTAFVTGVFLTIIGFSLAPWIFKLMGAEGDVLNNAIAYLRIRSFELPLLFLFFALTAIRQAEGNTIQPMVIGVSVVLLNIILSPIFISVIGIGVLGAAYATLASYILMSPFVLIKLSSKKELLHLDHLFKHTDSKIIKKIIFVALPASAGQAITAVGFIVMNGFILSYGSQVVSAFSVGNRISSMILHPVMAMGSILAAYIGQNIGAGNIKRARETFRKSMILSIGIMIVFSLILMFFKRSIAAIFLWQDIEALNLANDYLTFLLLGLPLMAIYQTFIGTFNGNGVTLFTLIFGVTRLWLLRLPLIFVFKNFTDFGPSGIWYALIISNIVIVLVGIFLYQFLSFKPRIEAADIEFEAA
jgi:putative MATE family efflux protein